MVPGTKDDPRPAKIVIKEGRLQARTPRRNRLLGEFNDRNQFVIKCGDEFVIVEIPRSSKEFDRAS